MLGGLAELATTPPPGADPAFPVELTAGETALVHRTIFRDPAWRKRDAAGALRVSAANAEAIGLAEGDQAVVTTKRCSARVVVEISAVMRAGHIGLGVIHEQGEAPVGARPPNELTSSEHRDPIAGTPYHKHLPARSRQSRHEPAAL
jgi:anaerobic selenocysteine-containing dehydrogenase